MRKRKSPKSFPAARKLALRSGVSVESDQYEIERLFKLPSGSVRLLLPSGRAARSDKSIAALARDWSY
jgi:hypothetical protein